MTALPYDVLDTIASYWSGRAMTLTCRRYAARANIDAHIVHEYYVVDGDNHVVVDGL